MKKTIFTFCSIAVVCCAIFFACAKDDNSITHVSYASQNGNGTGGNPNPNGLPSSSGYGTATTSGSTTSSTSSTSGTTTGTTPVVNSVTITTSSGPATSTITGQTCGSTYMNGNGTAQIGTISLSFSTAPAAGTYNVVSNNPGATDVLVSDNGNYASGGTVTITVVNGKNYATFNNVTGTAPTSFTLTGGFGCP